MTIWVLKPVDHLPDLLVGHDLKYPDFGLLPGIEKRIDAGQEFLLIRLDVRIGLVDIVNDALHAFIGIAPLNHSSKQIHRLKPAHGDIEPLVYELFEEGQNLYKQFIADLGVLRKLVDIKAKDHAFQFDARTPEGLLSLLRRPGSTPQHDKYASGGDEPSHGLREVSF